MQKSAARPYSNRPPDRQFLTMALDGLPYGCFFDDRSGRYSIDMVRIKFVYSAKYYDYDRKQTRNTLDDLCAYLDHFRLDSEVRWNYSDFRVGRYSSVATFEFVNGGKASFMIGRYDCKSSRQVAAEIVAEFNPNKVRAEDICPILAALALQAVKTPELVRFDLAIDIPISRSAAYLQFAGRREYRLFRNSAEDLTEYLGKRHSHGSLKLYNKGLESRLPITVTRCELTIEPNRFQSLSNILPDLYFDYDFQIDTEFEKLPFEVRACLLHPDLIPILKQSVSANTWKKHKARLDSYEAFRFAPADLSGIDEFIRGQLAFWTDQKNWLTFRFS